MERDPALQLDGVDRILVVMAHPDDCDFGAAGTIARWTQAGVDVRYLIVTDGDQGGFDASISRPDMARLRRAEQTAAARLVGVSDITFLGYPDGRLTVSLELRRDISRVIRQQKPQRVVCQSPEIVYTRIHGSHPDHRAAGEAALIAVYPDARNQFAHPELLANEGLGEHKVPSVWIVGHPEPNHAVDISETFSSKLAAIRCHQSQLPSVPELEGMMHEWAARTAARMGLGADRLAEAFMVIDTQ